MACVTASPSRRDLLRAGAALSLTALGSDRTEAANLPLAAPPTLPADTVAPGYARDVLARWGDRVTFDAKPWHPRTPTAEAAETQFGWDGLLLGLLVPPVGGDGVPRGILAVAHPTVDPAMAFPGGVDQPEVAAAMQGASLLNVERQGERWIVSDGGYQSRRLTANTLCHVSGPAAAGIGETVRGLLNVSGGCWTPWGSLLLAEGDPAGWSTRLRGVDARFADARGFGWVAELDGTEPAAVPVKRTALGRFAHGDVASAMTADGRAVIYMTDRRADGFLFRFTSVGSARAQDALDNGTLAVARVEGDRLHWIALPRVLVALTDTVAIAARLGATGFDYPSGLDLDRGDGSLFLACRGQPGVSPPAPGRVVQIVPDGRDHGAESAQASVLLRGGPARVPGRAALEHPDTVAADGAGRVWIGTDRGGRLGPAPDLLVGVEVAGPQRGLPGVLYAAPRGAAIGGATPAPGGTAVFAIVRTPGAEPGASWDRPGTTWPAFDGNTPPRTTLITLSRLRPGRVGD